MALYGKTRRPGTILVIFLNFALVSLSVQEKETTKHNNGPASLSLSLPLTLSRHNLSSLYQSSLAAAAAKPNGYNYKSSFRYSVALILELQIGTPAQTQQMVLDTGSQLSWIPCHREAPKRPPLSSVFYPSLSSSFSALPCNHPLCKPRVPDFTLPTDCDQNRLCHYSYFYADGTLAEGNLVREKFAMSNSLSTPPLILGCAATSSDSDSDSDGKGILGMNLGRLSFASQAKVSKFSYCVPSRFGSGPNPTGSFYLGENPDSASFQYVNFMTFPQSQRLPNLDPLAYTLPMQGIKIGGRLLDIPASVFRPDAGGSGQTMIDSGSEFTYLVDDAYSKVKGEIVRLVGPGKIKNGYSYGGGVADICFDAVRAAEVGKLVGSMGFVFANAVEIPVAGERMLADVGGGVRCVAVGMSSRMGAASNIIGNFHQQNLWVEFDLANHRVGFGRADCTRSR